MFFLKQFYNLGEKTLADTFRFWTMSIADFLDEYFETDVIKAHLSRERYHWDGFGCLCRVLHMYFCTITWAKLMAALVLGVSRGVVWDLYPRLSRVLFRNLAAR